MASITTFRGRRCTKVRRQLNSSQTASPSASVKASSQGANSSSLNNSFFPDSTTATPRSSVQVASIQNLPPDAAPTRTNAPNPPPKPAPTPPPKPPAPPPPPPAATSAAPPPTVAPAPPADPPPTSAASSKVRSLGGGDGGAPAPAATNGPPPPAPDSPPPPAQQGPPPVAPGPAPGSGSDGSPQAQPQPQPQSPNAPNVAPAVNPQAVPVVSTVPQPNDPNAPPVEPSLDPGLVGQPGIASPVLQSIGVGGVPLVSPGPQLGNEPGALPITAPLVSTGRASPSKASPKSPKSSSSSDIGRNNPSLGPGSTQTGTAIPGVTSGTQGRNAGVVGGVLGGIAGLALLAGLLFFCFRRKGWKPFRRRHSAPDRPFSQQYSDRASSPLTRHVRSLFANRRSNNSNNENESPRSTTPALERGSYVAEVNNPPRRRSFSEGAVSFGTRAPLANVPSEAAPKLNNIPPILPPIALGDHRRSVSSISGVAYPVLTESNNPFRDPDPSAPLRMMNPDYSRTNTPAQTPGVTKITAPAGAFFAPKSSALLPESGLGIQRQNESAEYDPFRDPEVDPFADPVKTSSEEQRLQAPLIPSPALAQSPRRPGDPPTPARLSHTRSRTFANGIPIITTTSPSISSRHNPQASADSGFASASPQSINTARFPGRFRSMGGRSDVNSRASTASSTASSQPGSWGEPGPTRPASYNRSEINSRASDPFDLDRPEFLAYVGNESRYSGFTLSRQGSQRSINQLERKEGKGKR